jgi:GTP-binding protein HflX
VVDASAPDVGGNMRAVREVLATIGADHVPEMVAFNKADLVPFEAERLRATHEGSVALSAVTGEGVDLLVATIGDRLRSLTTVVELVIPFERGDLLAAVHRAGEVLAEEPGEGGMRLRGRFDDASVGRFREYVVG